MRGGTGISLKQYPNKGPFYFFTLQAAERTKREVAEEYSVHLFPPHPQVGGGTAAQDDEGAALDSDDDADAPKSAAPSRQPSNATHPYNIRKAAMALQRSPGRLPEERRRQIQAQVRRYVRAVELWLVDAEAEAPAEDAELTAAEVWAGLLAGMGGSSRRRTIRRWLKQGNELPARLVEEAQEGGVRNGGGGGVQSGSMGHAWHGQRVVEVATQRGGDAELAALCVRFRKSFVDALRPAHLPLGWEVEHRAPRAFGDHSIYGGAGGEEEEEDDDDDDEEEAA